MGCCTAVGAGALAAMCVLEAAAAEDAGAGALLRQPAPDAGIYMHRCEDLPHVAAQTRCCGDLSQMSAQALRCGDVPQPAQRGAVTICCRCRRRRDAVLTCLTCLC